MSIKVTQRVVGYILLAVMLMFAVYSNIRLAIRNYELRKTAEVGRQEVESIKQRNEKLSLLLTFYETPEYQEVEAKRRLGLKKPDETALLVSGLPANSLVETLEDFVYKEPIPEEPRQETNIEKWWRYIRGNYQNN